MSSWAELFDEKAQNIFTASKDIYRQALLAEDGNEEARSDAKDSKEEIKIFAQVRGVIIEIQIFSKLFKPCFSIFVTKRGLFEFMERLARFKIYNLMIS